MTPQEQAKSFIDQATQSIQSGQFPQALELADQALTFDQYNVDALIVKAIALSQTNQADNATATFRQALNLDPQNAKAAYNYAVHCYSLGRKQEAFDLSRQAVSSDPSHSGARDLATRLEQELGTPVAERPSQEIPTMSAPTGFTPAQQSSGYEPPLHSLKWVERLGPGWTALGWVASILLIGVLVLFLTTMVPIWGEIIQNAGDQAKVREITQSHHSAILSIAMWAGWILSIGWLTIDILDRRSSWLWMLPGILCTFFLLGWIVLPIYILAGRNPRKV